MKHRIVWTAQAQVDLREIKNYIAKDAPATARAFIRRIKESVKRLADFPFAGTVVPELDQESIRELFRLVHRPARGRWGQESCRLANG